MEEKRTKNSPGMLLSAARRPPPPTHAHGHAQDSRILSDSHRKTKTTADGLINHGHGYTPTGRAVGRWAVGGEGGSLIRSHLILLGLTRT